MRISEKVTTIYPPPLNIVKYVFKHIFLSKNDAIVELKDAAVTDFVYLSAFKNFDVTCASVENVAERNTVG